MTITNVNSVAQEFFSTIYSQALSPTGDLIAVSNNFGQISVLPVSNAEFLSSKHTAVVSSLTNTTALLSQDSGDLLFAGTSSGQISAFSWKSLCSGSSDAMVSISGRPGNQINSMISLGSGQFIGLGFDDGGLEIRDVSALEKIVATYSPHESQINQVVSYCDRQIVTCSSDGTITLIDPAAGHQPVRRVSASENAKLHRPQHSRGIYAIGVQDQFVIAGGGLAAARFDLASGALIHTYEEAKSTPAGGYNVTAVETTPTGFVCLGTSHGSLLAYSPSSALINEVQAGLGPLWNVSALPIDSPTVTAVSGAGSRISMVVSYGYVSYSLDSQVSG